MKKKPIFVWIDLEMTGLDPKKDVILEAAMIITDHMLVIQESLPPFIIHYKKNELPEMQPIVKNMHKKSGLIDAVEKATIRVPEVAQRLLSSIKKHAGCREAYLAGNSVWQDKAFLQKYMPDITSYLHYRILDVSSFKIALQSWGQKDAPFAAKAKNHRALDDIKESIEELKHYKKFFMLK